MKYLKRKLNKVLLKEENCTGKIRQKRLNIQKRKSKIDFLLKNISVNQLEH